MALPAASNAEKNRDARRKLLHDYMPVICGLFVVEEKLRQNADAP
jgi:hypothetical protein